MESQNDEIEIDLLDMCKYFLSKWIWMLLAIFLCGGIAFGYAKMKSVTEYISKTKVYVTVPKTSDKVLIRDNANELLVDYMKLINTDLMTEEIADRTKIEKTRIEKALTAEQEENSRLLTITVRTQSKEDTNTIAKEVILVFQDVVTNTLKKDPVIVVENPSKPEAEESVSTKKMTLMGAAGGFVLVIGIMFVLYLVKINCELKR